MFYCSFYRTRTLTAECHTIWLLFALLSISFYYSLFSSKLTIKSFHYKAFSHYQNIFFLNSFSFIVWNISREWIFVMMWNHNKNNKCKSYIDFLYIFFYYKWTILQDISFKDNGTNFSFISVLLTRVSIFRNFCFKTSAKHIKNVERNNFTPKMKEKFVWKKLK